MSGITYDHIYGLIAQADQDGAAMRVTFRCPVAGTTVEARAPLRKADTVAEKAKSGAKRRLAWSLRSAVSRAAYSAMGGGMAGSMASGAARGATSDVGAGVSYSDEEKKTAIVEAFQSVAQQFVWDAHTNRFISFQAAGEVMGDFMQQLNTFPVNTPYDRQVCARILTEIACADGHLGDDERSFLSGFVTPDLGTVDALAQMQRLSPAELAETSTSQARDTLLMLAWSLALTDEDVSPEEQARLGEIASGLGITEERARQLQGFAQVYVVDQALRAAYATGGADPAALEAARDTGRRIGLGDDELERAEIRFRKRYGLM